MTFRDIKTGCCVYILHKDKMEATVGKVKDVSVPHTPMGQQFMMGAQVVDVTIEDGSSARTYTIPDNLTVTYAADMVIATDKEGILREVEAISASAEEAINQIDRRKAEKEACAKILQDWSPVYREQKANEERFAQMEARLVSMIENLLKK